MNFPLYIAKRYLKSKSSNNAINFITYIALLGVILGAAALFIVLSGFAGLKDFTLQFSSVVDPNLKAEAISGKSFVISSYQLSKLNEIDGIANCSKIIEERVFIECEGTTYPTGKIKGVDENFRNVVNINSVIEYGGWLEQNTNQIVVGWGISNTLAFGILDFNKQVTVYVPKPGKGQISSIKNALTSVKTLNVGIFDINESLNNTYIYAPINLTKKLLNYKDNQITALEFKLEEDADESKIKKEIEFILGKEVIVKNRAQLNDALYKMLNTENLVVYLIFTLVLIIAFFNIIGSLIMMMIDKKKSIRTLFSVGATVKHIRKIFFLQGTLMSIIGGIIGLFIAAIILVLQKQFNLVMITPTIPYPVTIKLENFFIVFITIAVLGIIASKIASVRITKTLA